ncbi:hypothetical protein AAG570_010134 [Ranatra chinensis]|uniref:Uncharacterized protein n=1 Tax=Ranatra chinensis TaxID=642074 RepID=A0ABD0YXU3_9HEMI
MYPTRFSIYVTYGWGRGVFGFTANIGVARHTSAGYVSVLRVASGHKHFSPFPSCRLGIQLAAYATRLSRARPSEIKRHHDLGGYPGRGWNVPRLRIGRTWRNRPERVNLILSPLRESVPGDHRPNDRRGMKSPPKQTVVNSYQPLR